MKFKCIFNTIIGEGREQYAYTAVGELNFKNLTVTIEAHIESFKEELYAYIELEGKEFNLDLNLTDDNKIFNIVDNGLYQQLKKLTLKEQLEEDLINIKADLKKVKI